MAAGTGLDAGQDGWGACRTGRGHAHACPASAGAHADAAVDRAAAAGLPRPGSGRGGGAAVEVKDLAFFVLAASAVRSEEHTSELQSLMRISYAVFCLKKKK